MNSTDAYRWNGQANAGELVQLMRRILWGLRLIEDSPVHFLEVPDWLRDDLEDARAELMGLRPRLKTRWFQDAAILLDRIGAEILDDACQKEFIDEPQEIDDTIAARIIRDQQCCAILGRLAAELATGQAWVEGKHLGLIEPPPVELAEGPASIDREPGRAEPPSVPALDELAGGLTDGQVGVLEFLDRRWPRKTLRRNIIPAQGPTSHKPVSEALNRLIALGLACDKPREGATITDRGREVVRRVSDAQLTRRLPTRP